MFAFWFLINNIEGVCTAHPITGRPVSKLRRQASVWLWTDRGDHRSNLVFKLHYQWKVWGKNSFEKCPPFIDITLKMISRSIYILNKLCTRKSKLELRRNITVRTLLSGPNTFIRERNQERGEANWTIERNHSLKAWIEIVALRKHHQPNRLRTLGFDLLLLLRRCWLRTRIARCLRKDSHFLKTILGEKASR